MLRTVSAATAALALLASCAPDSQAPVKVQALVLTSTGEYQPQEVQLTTVTDIVRLEGSVARFIGGANVTVDSNDPDLLHATDEASLERALVKNAGRPVTASYIQKDGVLWPADFHTWNLVTTYYALERANDYFRTVGGLTEADFGGPTTVYYFADFLLKDENPNPLRDNALYFPPVKAFLVLPFDKLQKAPLAINASILAHEYSHRVFNQKVYGGAAVPAPINAWNTAGGATPGVNILKSLDEGLADYHAYGTSCVGPSGCNPRVLSTSFDDASVAERDLSKNQCMTAQLRAQLYGASYGAFNGLEYNVGTILANALYTAGQNTGQAKVIQRAVVAAYSDNSSSTPGLAQLTAAAMNNQEQFTLEVALGAIANHISDNTLKLAVCNQFIEHLGVFHDDLVAAGCPIGTQTRPTSSSCPDIVSN